MTTEKAAAEEKPEYDYDWFVIGTGPAGEKAATQAAYFGKRVAIVERQPAVGGAWINTGTLPSKTLRETAKYMSGLGQRELYGLSCRVEKGVTVQDLMCRQESVIATQRERLLRNLEKHNISLLKGRAQFIDEHTVEITPDYGVPHRVTFDACLIATGTSPHRPEFVPFEDPDVDDSDSILRIDKLPASMVVLGGGVIGCEYASIFAALGCKVVIIEGRGELLGFLDREINQKLTAGLQKLGCETVFKSEVVEVGRRDGKLSCVLKDGRVFECERLLFAGGRAGNTGNLKLDRLGVTPNERGLLKTDDHYRVADAKGGRIYAAGDVIGFPALASVAMEQGRVAACDAFDIDFKKKVASIFPYGLYTIPEVSMIGETEESARKKGLDFEVGRGMYKENARAQIIGDLEGIVKVLFTVPDKKVIGVHIMGERATEIIHVGQMVMHFGGTIDDFIAQVFNTPTLCEAYKYAAYDGLGRLRRLLKRREVVHTA